MSAKRHPVELPSCDLCPEEIGRYLARLRFDVMLRILRAFRSELRTQGLADQKRNRTLLATSLFESVDRMSPFLMHLASAWRISKPHMRAELEKFPEVR